MIWGLFLSLIFIVKWILQMLQIEIPFPIEIIINNFRIVATIAKSLMFSVIFFFIYLNQLVLKRIPEFNHDFLGLFFIVANMVISFVLGCVHTSVDQKLTFFVFFGDLEDAIKAPKIR